MVTLLALIELFKITQNQARERAEERRRNGRRKRGGDLKSGRGMSGKGERKVRERSGVRGWAARCA